MASLLRLTFLAVLFLPLFLAGAQETNLYPSPLCPDPNQLLVAPPVQGSSIAQCAFNPCFGGNNPCFGGGVCTPVKQTTSDNGFVVTNRCSCRSESPYTRQIVNIPVSPGANVTYQRDFCLRPNGDPCNPYPCNGGICSAPSYGGFQCSCPTLFPTMAPLRCAPQTTGLQGFCGTGNAADFPTRCYSASSTYICCDSDGCDRLANSAVPVTPKCLGNSYGIAFAETPPPIPFPTSTPRPEGSCGLLNSTDFPIRCNFNNSPLESSSYICCDSKGCNGLEADGVTPKCLGEAFRSGDAPTPPPSPFPTNPTPTGSQATPTPTPTETPTPTGNPVNCISSFPAPGVCDYTSATPNQCFNDDSSSYTCCSGSCGSPNGHVAFCSGQVPGTTPPCFPAGGTCDPLSTLPNQCFNANGSSYVCCPGSCGTPSDALPFCA